MRICDRCGGEEPAKSYSLKLFEEDIFTVVAEEEDLCDECIKVIKTAIENLFRKVTDVGLEEEEEVPEE